MPRSFHPWALTLNADEIWSQTGHTERADKEGEMCNIRRGLSATTGFFRGRGAD